MDKTRLSIKIGKVGTLQANPKIWEIWGALIESLRYIKAIKGISYNLLMTKRYLSTQKFHCNITRKGKLKSSIIRIKVKKESLNLWQQKVLDLNKIMEQNIPLILTRLQKLQ